VNSFTAVVELRSECFQLWMQSTFCLARMQFFHLAYTVQATNYPPVPTGGGVKVWVGRFSVVNIGFDVGSTQYLEL